MLQRVLIAMTIVALACCTSACSTPSFCNSAGCGSRLRAEGELDAHIMQQVVLTLDLCRNDVCSSGSADTDDSEPGDFSVTAELSGEANVHALVSRQTNSDYWWLFVTFREEDAAGPFADGDELHVRVFDDGNQVQLLDLTQPVSYEQLAPNGVECGPVCTVQTVELTLK